LDSRILFLPGLHLIPDQRAANKPDRRSDASSCTGVPVALPMIAPKPAPENVPIAAPFSLVVSGSEQPTNNALSNRADINAADSFISNSSAFDV
jgi:hypothetical protein